MDTPDSLSTALPRISVVTPSYNQAAFLESTITSVLSQGYPNLEYIVIDGGSTDGSADIIQRYSNQLAYWVSEPDSGQSHAINKGFDKSTGELFCWINSDDFYLPGALVAVGQAYRSAPGTLVAASVVTVDQRPGRAIADQVTRHADLSFERLVRLGRHPVPYHQPGVFFPAWAWRRVDGLDETLVYTMDYDLLCRLLQVCAVTYIPDVVAQFRLHGESKTCSQWLAMLDEQIAVAHRYAREAGIVDDRSFDEYVVEGLVMHSGTEVLRGHVREAAELLQRALRKDLGLTLRAGIGQVANGVLRHAAR
jgi:glycosyltransferase involved in cell wall biosynthesis